jgi:hypothetical protein
MSAETALSEALARLEALLAEERDAVGRLDATALTRIAPAKLAALAELRRLGDDAGARGDDGDGRAARELLETGLRRVVIVADANRLLMAEAIEAIAEARGLGRAPGTYDRRARVTQGPRGLTARNL